MEREATRLPDSSGSTLRLLSVPPPVWRFSGTVGHMLDLPVQRVQDLFAAAPCLLPVPPGSDMRRLRVGLTAVGLRIGTVADDQSDRVDLCLHLSPFADLDGLAVMLAPVLQPVSAMTPAALRDRLLAVDGCVLADLSPVTADRVTRRLRRFRQISVLRSVRDKAVFDLFAPKAAPPLTAHLRLLGHAEDPVTGAIAAGLDRQIADHLRHRFADLRIVDRAFQRFDLMLTQVAPDISDDIADFLTARTAMPRDRFGLVSANAPIRLERALPRQTALRFHADYRQIGLQTHVRLVATAVAQPAPS